MFSLSIVVVVLNTALADYTDPHCGGKQVIVQLFEWKFSDIAEECERHLGQKDFCGVQVSPVNEYAVIENHPWTERYQPVSYTIVSRSGDEKAFKDMVVRCKNVGVRIYVDVVINHMTKVETSGIGIGGTSFDTRTYNFIGLPYEIGHFSYQRKCHSANGTVINFNDPNEVRNCNLEGLLDLDQSQDYVRNKIAEFFNHLIDLGVAGFRVDSAKFMWPGDIYQIQQLTKDLPEGGKPFFYLEVNDYSYTDVIKSKEYYQNGMVTEFKFSERIVKDIKQFSSLDNVYDSSRGMVDSAHALVFVDNPEIQRNSNEMISHKTPELYKMANAFMLANDYGFPRVMSSYYFDSSLMGPPHYTDFNIKNVSVGVRGVCGNGWVCEHRWNAIGNMVAFRNGVAGTNKTHLKNDNNTISFARGTKGFFAMTRRIPLDQTLPTGLKSGTYCDLISDCNKTVTVDTNGDAHIVIHVGDEPIIAFLVDGPEPSSKPFHGIHAGKTITDIGSTGSGLNATNGTDTGSGSGSLIGTTTTVAVVTQNYTRTVILFEAHTKDGEDLFIRGGIDENHREGCRNPPNPSLDPCAIPIRSRDMGNSSHYDKYNAWRLGDEFLDWHGPEPNQRSYQGRPPGGTPAVWTTNDPGDTNHRYNSLNVYGAHYWLVDIDMDCSKTINGWFEVKALWNTGWEHNRSLLLKVCNFEEPVPYKSPNHWAKCGMKNVFHFDEDRCTISKI